MIAHFNEGLAVEHHLARLDEPARRPAAARASTTRSRASSCSSLGLAVGLGALALALPHAHGHGDPRRRRRPPDDLGARRQHPAHVRDRLRRRLGARRPSAASSAPRREPSRRARTAQWLLNSLVVVIIGGLGSLLGAAVGSLLYGLVVLVLGRLPADDRRQLLHPVLDRLHVRAARARARVPAAGPLREIRVTRDPKAVTERAIGDRRRSIVARRSRPLIFNAYWVDVILTQALIVGIAAASLIFLAAYGGMVSLAQTMLMGIGRLHDRQHGHEGGAGGESKGLTLGWDPTLALVARARRHDAARPPLRRPRRAEHRHLLPDDHAHLLGDRLLLRRPGDGRLGLLRDRRASTSTRRRSSATSSTTATASTTSRSASRSSSTLLIRYLIRTPFGLALQGLRDEPVRMSSLGYAVAAAPDARLRLRRLPRGARRRPARLVARADRARATSACRRRSTC